MTKSIIHDLVEIYAIDGLVGRREVIQRAVQRAVSARAAGVSPLGDWKGIVGPHVDGHMNFISGVIPSPAEPHVIRCGGNGGGISRDISLVPSSLRSKR